MPLDADADVGVMRSDPDDLQGAATSTRRQRQRLDACAAVEDDERQRVLDQKRIGMTTWCETQKTRLSGFIRSKN